MGLKISLSVLLTTITFASFSQVFPGGYQGGNLFFGPAYTPRTLVEKNSNAYLFTIEYTDGTTETLKSKIDSYNKIFYLAVDLPGITKSIKPTQTLSISRTTSKGEVLKGLAADSCWLFKITTGKINLYSTLAETKTKFVIAIQAGTDGPIVPLTFQQVEAIIPKDNPAWKSSSDNLIKVIEHYNGQ